MKNKDLIKFLVIDSINKAINYYGIEGTEEKIKSVYKNMPYLKYYMLREYYSLTNRSDIWKKIKD